MKKILIHLLLILPAFSFAQKIKFGPEAGLNVALLHKSDIGNNTQLAYTFGGNFRYSISKHLQFNSGIYWAQKKVHYQENYSQPNTMINTLIELAGGFDSLGIEPTLINTSSDVNVEGVIKEHFIQLPLEIIYNYKRLNFFGGAYAGYLLTAKRNEIKETRFALTEAIDIGELVGGGTTGAFINSFLPPPYKKEISSSHSKKDLNKLDIGFTLGAGYELDNFCFALHYTQGLLDYRSSGGSERQSFNYISFTTTYLFNIKDKVNTILKEE